MRFTDRVEAGKLLAEKLLRRGRVENPLVLALPRGGVPVALEVAKVLDAPLDLFLVRKLGVPGEEELAMGAISLHNTIILDQHITDQLAIPPEEIEAVILKEKAELERRNQLYRQGREAPDIEGHSVILVDDGIATGSTMQAAIAALRTKAAKTVIAAVPVAPATVYTALKDADEVVVLQTPIPFLSVSYHYEEFPQVEDEEVLEMLQQYALATV